MAIAVEATFHGQGATLENYNKAIQIMGATPGGPIQIQAVFSTG